MSALSSFIAAGLAVALLGAPVSAADRIDKIAPAQASAQEECRGWGVSCDIGATPDFCIAEHKCATALPASALIRYDARMDAALGR